MTELSNCYIVELHKIHNITPALWNDIGSWRRYKSRWFEYIVVLHLLRIGFIVIIIHPL